MNIKQTGIILVHAFIGWALCGAVIWVGQAFATMKIALIAHAVAVPFIFTFVAWVYYKRCAYANPLQTAAAFFAVVVCLDIFLVALLIEQSFAMFESVIGTWIPFALIFASTYFTGCFLQISTDEQNEATG